MENRSNKFTHTILIGKTYTANSHDDFVESMVIADGKIVFLGNIEDSHEYLQNLNISLDNIKTVKLKPTQLVLPGFIDSHIHPLAGGISESSINVSSCNSVKDVLEMIKEFYLKHPNMDFIFAVGYNDANYPKEDFELLNYRSLDTITADIPIVIKRYDGHAYWCNSALIKAAGVNNMCTDTFSNMGGKIDLHENGQVLGIFHDDAMDIIKKVFPKLNSQKKINLLLEVSKFLLSYGITSYMDAATKLRNFEIFKSVYSDKRYIDDLPRCSLSILTKSDHDDPSKREESSVSSDIKITDIFFLLNRIKEWNNNDFNTGNNDENNIIPNSTFINKFRVNTVKIFVDGVFESGTALFSCDSFKCYNNSGIPKGDLQMLVDYLYKNEIQIHTHCIGDLATKMVIDSIENARKKYVNNREKNYIAHLNLVKLVDIKRMKDHNIYGNMSPFWFQEDNFSPEIEKLIGKERLIEVYPIRWFIDNGVKVGFGSDWPVTSINPLEGIEVAVTHRQLGMSMDTPCYIPEHKISIYEAIKAYTIISAEILDLETITGSLEVGKFADLVVLDKNIFELDPSQIHTATVDMTLISGKLVYDKNSL